MELDSVYNLITNLCEKYSNNNTNLTKKLRTKSYEILLGKRVSNIPEAYRNVESPDPFCKLLSWQFVLANEFGLVEHGRKLRECVECLQTAYGEDTNTFNSILQFLLCLRNVPKDNEMSDIEDSTYFDIPDKFQKLFGNIQQYQEPQKQVVLKDDNDNNLNIWEIAAKSKYSKRRNWECFGYSELDKEPPFLTELGELSHLWVDNLPSVYIMKKYRDRIVKQSEIKEITDFVKDIKFLLVGMASDSFIYNENEEFVLKPNITLNGVSDITLEKYCKDFIMSGLCYKALNKISIQNPSTGKYKYEGFIFAEFCDSIRRYLEFYRVSVFNLRDTIGLIKLHYLTKQLRNQILILTSICKLGPYQESNEIPHGVSLLNYLYLNILSQIDRSVILVLYSVLFSCCQVYFNRFLQKWILEGSLNDPFDEFFIKCNYKYITTRGRTYWTRGYSLRGDIVPDFLLDLRNDILNCGKIMNLVKSCFPGSKLCLYLMGKMPPILSCCINSEQLKLLKRNTTIYYIEASLQCGSKASFEEIFRKSNEEDAYFIDVISKKRAITLKRIELERQEAVQCAKERKFDEMAMLKEEYDSVCRQRKMEIALKILKDIEEVQANLSIEALREKLIQKEANEMIEYYSNLCEKTEKKKKEIERHIETLKNINLEQSLNDSNATQSMDDNNCDIKKTEIDKKVENKIEEINENIDITNSLPSTIHSSNSLDIINANAIETIKIDNEGNQYDNETMKMAIENFEMARKIKRKVLSHDIGIFSTTPETNQLIIDDNIVLTDAQKNKLRVLSSEFAIEIKQKITKKPLTQLQKNRNQNMASNECFFSEINDKIEKSTANLLSLDFNKLKSINELDKPIPMSVDSTPLSDFSLLSTSPSKVCLSIEDTPMTTCTQTTDEGFNFDQIEEEETINSKPIYFVNNLDEIQKLVFSKRVNENEASDINVNCLHLFLYDSVSIPLTVQMKLVNNELLRYVINDLNYLQHLASLRNYFFLQDGEFGRNITENLFERLYEANIPAELINCRVLQRLVFNALDNSNKFEENSNFLSFKINNLPKCFDLGNPNVLDCLSLTYKIQWPLNILLPTDTIAKYDEVFKYLLKVSRVSWVLKKIFLELKILAKETGKKEIYLMMSPQYRRLHQCRHVMLHFMQTLQNYIVGEVLQSSWEIFKKNLSSITNFDDLYSAHTAYIKNILFLCLLNQKCAPLRKVIEKIFIVILKFYDYLRSRSWVCEDGNYIHPNFVKLESIFKNFIEFILFLFKVIRKVVKSGYQPHLIELLDMLDINGYFSNKKLIV